MKKNNNIEYELLDKLEELETQFNELREMTQEIKNKNIEKELVLI